jgi:hypothetical protein
MVLFKNFWTINRQTVDKSDLLCNKNYFYSLVSFALIVLLNNLVENAPIFTFRDGEGIY